MFFDESIDIMEVNFIHVFAYIIIQSRTVGRILMIFDQPSIVFDLVAFDAVIASANFGFPQNFISHRYLIVVVNFNSM